MLEPVHRGGLRAGSEPRWNFFALSSTSLLRRREGEEQTVLADGGRSGERDGSRLDNGENDLVSVDSPTHRHLDQLAEDQSEWIT